MELSDALTMKFAFAKSLLTGIVDENYKVVIKYYDNDGELVVKEVPYKDWIPYGANNYLATIDLAAKQMGDRMDVRMYDGNGYQIGDTYYDSIREYIGRQLDKNWFKDPAAPNTKGVTLAVAMLDYGAAAQTRFGYKTDDLANSIITSEMRAVVNELDLSVTNHQFKGSNFYGTSVAVENRIDIRMFFKNVKDDMYAIATYVDRDGKSQAVRYNSDVFVAYGTNYKGIRLDMLKAADYGYVVTVTMYNADGTVHGTATDSVESYAARVFATSDEELKTVVQALTKYCKASYAYFVG